VYVSFFPCLFCGPISRSDDQLIQYYNKRKFQYDAALAGCKLMLWGLFAKLCVADRMGIYVDAVFGNITENNGTSLLLASLLYTVQIYADFAGYSFMAIGAGKLLGIELKTNFVRPYCAKTVTEFWRRWHISLTTWFRDYIYFPMGGNRVNKVRWMFNTMVVFVVSGLWHGAEYTFLIWGALHGMFMIAERQMYGAKIKEISNNLTFSNVIRMCVTFLIVTFAWVFFRADNFSDASLVIGKIFSSAGMPYLDLHTLLYSFVFGGIMLLKDFRDEFFPNKFPVFESKKKAVRIVSYYLLIFFILEYGANGQSFIYFQF